MDFKDKYKAQWTESAAREKMLRERIEQQTGHTLRASGFGAESTEYIKGDARSNGHEVADADYMIDYIPLAIEITGPLTGASSLESDIWIRPDKIAIAKKHIDEYKTALIHHIKAIDVARVIMLDKDFFSAQTGVRIVNPFIRGSRETFVSVPARHNSVKSWDQFISYLKTIPIPIVTNK